MERSRNGEEEGKKDATALREMHSKKRTCPYPRKEVQITEKPACDHNLSIRVSLRFTEVWIEVKIL